LGVIPGALPPEPDPELPPQPPEPEPLLEPELQPAEEVETAGADDVHCAQVVVTTTGAAEVDVQAAHVLVVLDAAAGVGFPTHNISTPRHPFIPSVNLQVGAP
jgi:hypothetical protein